MIEENKNEHKNILISVFLWIDKKVQVHAREGSDEIFKAGLMMTWIWSPKNLSLVSIILWRYFEINIENNSKID